MNSVIILLQLSLIQIMDPSVHLHVRPFTLLPQSLAVNQNQQIDHFTLNKLLSVKPYEIPLAQCQLEEDMFEFIESYEKQNKQENGNIIGTVKQARQLENDQRKERLIGQKAKILEKAEENRKKEMERLDQELALKIEQEEKDRLKVEKDEKIRREQMIIQLTQDTLKSPIKYSFEEAKNLLEQNKWNYAAAISKIKENERREMLVYQAMGNLNMEYIHAQNLLQQHGWNLDAAMRAVQGNHGPQQQPANAHGVTLNLVLTDNQNETFKQDFDKRNEGMVIIEYINRVKPLPQPKAGENPLYYRVYKDSKCTPQSHLSYIELTNPIHTLSFQHNSTLYLLKSMEPPF